MHMVRYHILDTTTFSDDFVHLISEAEDANINNVKTASATRIGKQV